MLPFIYSKPFKSKFDQKKLFNLGIQSRSIYAYPIHEMKAYKKIIKNKKNLQISFKNLGKSFHFLCILKLKILKLEE